MPTILGANSVRDTGYNVDNSLRFDAASSAKITRTISSSGSTKIFTTSFWMKLSAYGTSDAMPFGVDPDGSFGNNFVTMEINSDRKMRLDAYISGAYVFRLRTKRVFRDESGFYHIVFAVDTSQSTEANRVRLYVNGVEETDFESTSYPSLNTDININNSGNIINFGGRTGTFFPGYLCEVAYIDGTQLAASDFGEFDSDSPTHWKPKEFKDDVTFGTNGSYLEFKDSSALGDDTSGNDNDFSLTNLAAIDQCVDTCTNIFCTFTSTDPSASNFTLSEGNCRVDKSGSGAFGLYGTNIMLSKGKWYFEVKFTADAGSDRTRAGVAAFESVTGTSTIQGSFSGVEFTCTTSGRFNIVTSGSNNEIDGFNSYSTGDIIQFALDMDNQRLYIGINGNFFNYSSSNTGGNPASGSGFVTNSTTVLAAPVTPYAGHSVGVSGTSTLEFNFGNPTFSISSGNSDSEGFGNFEFSVPSGYFAICSKNLAEYGG